MPLLPLFPDPPPKNGDGKAPPSEGFVFRVGTNGRKPTKSNGYTSRLKPKSLFDRPPEREEPPAPLPAPPPEAPLPTPDIASTDRQKALDILAAIRTLKTVEEEKRPATPQEKQALARFCGFGPVALRIFPDPVKGTYKDGWQSIGEELKALLTPQEYDSAKRTTFNAFYTSPVVMQAIHAGVGRFGVPEDGLVLEPGAGIGRFMTGPHRYIGVELDSISGRISRLLHPQADIRIENFRDTKLPPLDSVIGNVPFANLQMEHNGQKFSLHDFFIAKSVDALKPGGVLAVVTSHFTLDKQNAAAREYLAERADFLGAIRLPSDAFKREGTAVVTDIVFLRKRGKDEQVNHADPAWLETAPLEVEGASVSVNRYFLNHPEQVLGTWSREKTLYGDDSYSVQSNGNLAEQLRDAVERLPMPERHQVNGQTHQVSSKSSTERPSFTPPPPLKHIAEGSFFLSDDRTICQSVGGQSVPVNYGGSILTGYGGMTGKRFASLIGLRDKARRVLQSQNDGWPEANRIEARKELNWAYERFTSAYGPINKTTFSETKDGTTIRRMPNIVKFREDPDAMLVMSLEDYDEVTGKATKAAIMLKDVVGKNPAVTHVNSAEEGLLVSLNQRGAVDLAFISGLYGKPEETIIAELGDLMFENPENKKFEVADQYLSGNVRAKLAQAEAAGYTRNADALRAVQPEDVLPGDIDANLGAPWIPESDIQGFATDIFQASGIQVGHMKKDAVWSISADYAALHSVPATADFGTPRINGTQLLELALNMKTPVIYDPDPADPDKRVVNQEETLKAKEKQKQIKERFKSWVFGDSDRTERLVRIYNDTYNNLRPRLFDGSHLDFPGMNQTVKMNKHQVDAVWRCMSGGNTLLAHCVGAGKSFEMAAAAMKMKQAGLIHKPLIAVPNHLLEQFGREWMQLYPNAKLLIASKEDMTRDRRKYLTAKIASGEWDGIIVTHSSFERIGMSRDYQEKFLNEQIAEYDQLLLEHASTKGGNRNLIKTIEKQKANREEKLKDLLAEDKKDDGLVFDEVGVDHLFVDEIQAHKNLETPSKMDRVAGIQTGGSERAFDLFMKARYLDEKHPGHGLVGASGTPISNSIVEMYTMQRFFDPAGLRSRGIEHFDAWAATFGEVVDTMEISPDGKTLKPRSRFSKFVNLPELQMMFRSFADVQTADMLDLPCPKLEGGKPHIVACPMSEEQASLQMELVARYERIRSQKVDPREDNALAITTDGRKLALDARMLSPNADHNPDSKISAMVENVVSVWKRTAPTRGTQMIFCDMGVNPTPWGYSAYDDVIKQLIARGIPRNEIAAIGDADSDAKKKSLFDKVRSGQIRVLIGSTQKMGTGTNVQKRLVALHHLDAPWKPAEVEQREGRILRQGNDNEQVAIYRYVTEGSFDAYMWQALETKARFISQIMSGESGVRRAEDIGGQELSYAEVKAIASGNPAVLTLAEADAELQRLTVLKRNHLDEQFTARRRVRDLPEQIRQTAKRLTALEADSATLKTNADDYITIGSRPVSEPIAVLGERLDSLPLVYQTQKTPLGVYRGLRFGIIQHPQWNPEVYLEGEITRQDTLSRDHHGPRAVLNAVERLAGGYNVETVRARRDLEIMEGQLRDYQARLGQPFPHERYLSELTALRDKLKVGLSGEPKEGEPTAAELAERIKTLRASVTVEPAPQRTAKRQTAAEEPVTARIRRREQEAGGADEGKWERRVNEGEERSAGRE
jgi:N12 class adenine-specific DNA methylase